MKVDRRGFLAALVVAPVVAKIAPVPDQPAEIDTTIGLNEYLRRNAFVIDNNHVKARLRSFSDVPDWAKFNETMRPYLDRNQKRAYAYVTPRAAEAIERAARRRGRRI